MDWICLESIFCVDYIVCITHCSTRFEIALVHACVCSAGQLILFREFVLLSSVTSTDDKCPQLTIYFVWEIRNEINSNLHYFVSKWNETLL